MIHLDENTKNNNANNLQWVEDTKWYKNRKKPESVSGVYVRCIQTNKIYISITEASRDTGLSMTTIKNNCDGRTRWAKDHTKWEYLDEVRKTEKIYTKNPINKIETIDDLDGEIWKPVPYKNYSKLYSISNMGRLKSYHSLSKDKIIKPIILEKRKERTNTTFFAVNNLHYQNEILNISLPKLVAEMFVPNPNNYDKLRFLDGDPTNYKADNLEWYDDSKAKSERAREIYELYRDHQSTYRKPVRCIETGQEFESITEAANFMKISMGYISQVCNGKGYTSNGYHWKFIDKNDSYNPKIKNKKS